MDLRNKLDEACLDVILERILLLNSPWASREQVIKRNVFDFNLFTGDLSVDVKDLRTATDLDRIKIFRLRESSLYFHASYIKCFGSGPEIINAN